jgi:hypothetical protein
MESMTQCVREVRSLVKHVSPGLAGLRQVKVEAWILQAWTLPLRQAGKTASFSPVISYPMDKEEPNCYSSHPQSFPLTCVYNCPSPTLFTSLFRLIHPLDPLARSCFSYTF